MTKKVISVVLFVAVLLGLLWRQSVKAAPSQNMIYESGLIWAQQNEAISGLVLNLDVVPHNFRVVVSGTTSGFVPAVLLDSGTVSIPAGSLSHVDYTVPSGTFPNYFAVEITTDSDEIVPTVQVVQQGGTSFPFPPPRYWLTGSQLVKFR